MHIYFGDCFNTKVDGNEWFDFSKQKNQELLYRICPILLLSSISLYKNDGFDYSNEFWEKFTNWLQQHSNDNCKKYNSFLKNEKYKEYKNFVRLNYSKNEKQNKQKENNIKAKTTIKQNTNNLCKYETIDKSGRRILNWKLFFDDHKELVGKKVYCNFDKDKKYLAKIVKFKDGMYGVIFNNEEMSFSGYTLYLYKKIKDPNTKYSFQGTNYVCFIDSGKSLLETYNELKKQS